MACVYKAPQLNSYSAMFSTVCFEHWDLWFARPVPAAYNLFYCTCADCAWCELHQTLCDFRRNRRFIQNLTRFSRQPPRRAHRLFVISEAEQ